VYPEPIEIEGWNNGAIESMRVFVDRDGDVWIETNDDDDDATVIVCGKDARALGNWLIALADAREAEATAKESAEGGPK
jgi:hypothetical protein